MKITRITLLVLSERGAKLNANERVLKSNGLMILVLEVMSKVMT